MSFTTKSVLMCPHGGTVDLTPNGRVQLRGGYLLRPSDAVTIKGCLLASANPPRPCVSVNWLASALKTRVAGQFILTANSQGACHAADGTPQGTVLASPEQQAKAT